MPIAPQCCQTIGAGSVDELFRDVPEEARLKGPIHGLPMHASEMAVERDMTAMARKNMVARRRALLPRLRRLQASCPGQRRSSDPARRVPDRLHALPARNRAGHAAGPVRIPDPGRAAVRLRSRQRLDVRRLDRLLGSDRHGAADHAQDEGDPLLGPAPALRLGLQDDGEVHRRHARRRALPELDRRDRRRAADREHRRRDQLRRRPISRHSRPDRRPHADRRGSACRGRAC